MKFSAFFGFPAFVFRTLLKLASSWHAAHPLPTSAGSALFPGLPPALSGLSPPSRPGPQMCHRSRSHLDAAFHAIAPEPRAGWAQGPPNTRVQVSFAGHSPSREPGWAMGAQTAPEHPLSRDSAPPPRRIDPHSWDAEGFPRINKTLADSEPRGSALTGSVRPGHGNYRCKSPWLHPPTQNGSRKGWCTAPTPASCSQPGPEHPPHRSRQLGWE